jgi:hypothetical protein
MRGLLLVRRNSLIMRPDQYHAENLKSLLRQQRIATMAELKHALGTGSHATVFRKLGELEYHSSYSHRGRFYTLGEIARFDELGLWAFRAVYFSRYGTLVATVEALVGASEAGYDVAELDATLHVDPKQPLLSLVRAGRLARQEIGGRYVYLAAGSSTRRQQLSARALADATPSGLSIGAGLRVLPDELKAAIVLFYSLLDERQRRLYAGLEALKIGHGGDTQIAELLGVDPATVARGRNELLAGDIDPSRVRRAGGGRPSAQKKPPRSSTESRS